MISGTQINMLKWADVTRKKLEHQNDSLDGLSIISSSSSGCISVNDLMLSPTPTRNGVPTSPTRPQVPRICKSQSLIITNDWSQREENGRCQSEQSDSGTEEGFSSNEVLKISTSVDEKNRKNSFWRNLRNRTVGKRTGRVLKSQSMTEFPDQHEEDEDPAPKPNHLFQSEKTKADITRRRSLKAVKRRAENKKPKPFSKTPEIRRRFIANGDDHRGNNRDSQISIDSYELDESPASDSPDDKPFNSIVLEYLRNMALEDQNSSENDTSDVFCYNVDTVIRNSEKKDKQLTDCSFQPEVDSPS